MDFIIIHESKGGTIGYDPEQAADSVLALLAAAHARGQEEGVEAAAQVVERWYELPDEVIDMDGGPTTEQIIANAIRRALSGPRDA